MEKKVEVLKQENMKEIRSIKKEENQKLNLS